MVDKTLGLGTMALLFSITVILSPIGLVAGLIAIGQAVQWLPLAKKHPNHRKLRRKLWWAIILSGLAILPFIGLILLVKALQGFPDFSGIGTLGSGWTWGCC